MVSKTIHISLFIEVDLPRGLLDPFSLNVIFNVDNIVMSLADRGHPLHPVTGEGELVNKRSRVLSSRV